MRIALVHDWLTGLRGGERVLDTLARAHPEAELYTLVHVPGATTPAIDALRIHTSPLDRMPGIARHYRKWLPLLPWAARRLEVGECDLVISVHHAVAKAARIPGRTPHLCYCLTPMRYVWDQTEAYLGQGLKRLVAAPVVAGLRAFDRRSAAPDRVDRFVAISTTVAQRVERHYGREAPVVHPPVDVERFDVRDGPDDFFLLVGGFVPYKREDVAIEAFRRHGGRLVVAGDGPLRERLARRAPPNVEFVGRVDDATLTDLMARCRALIHPQEEDFGITAVEVQAAGRPVIAYGRGGALDTVRPLASTPGETANTESPTGLYFEAQSPESLLAALDRFERECERFDPKRIREHAHRFGEARFLAALQAQIDALLGRSA